MSVKDWSPRQISTVLTEEEEAEYRRIVARHMQKEGEDSEDVRRLSNILLRAARITKEDFCFPPYAALLNPITQAAFTMRFSYRENAHEELTIGHGILGSAVAFEREFSTQVCDAILFVRPYVRLCEEFSEQALEILRRAKVLLTVDGEEMAHHSPLGEFLVTKTRGDFSRMPWKMSPFPPSLLFGAYDIPDTGNKPIYGGDMIELTQSKKNFLGLFLPNATKLRMELRFSGEKLEEPIRIVTGIVAARYTTKAAV